MMTPTEYSFVELVEKAPRYAVDTVKRWAVHRYWSVYFRIHPDHEAVDRDRAIGKIREADSVLFLCLGNICRSPMAERYLERRLTERGWDSIDVRSAGLGEIEGRTSPNTAIEAASTHAIDLSDHVSTLASSASIEESDIVFVMDYNNYHSVKTRFPNATDDVFFLGPLSGQGGDIVIPDPYGSGSERFTETYDVIADAIDTLVDDGVGRS